MKVLHLVNCALPDQQMGYTIRGHQIVTSQKAVGIDPVVVALDFRHRSEDEGGVYELDGVRHHSMTYPAQFRRGMLPKNLARAAALHAMKKSGRDVARIGREVLLTSWFEEKLAAVIRTERPDVLHAHSPYYCGSAALVVAKRFNIPWAYEVRGFWEESAITQGTTQRGSWWHRFRRAGETRVLRAADHVFVIAGELRREVERRGVAADRISLAPNAVDLAKFTPRPRDVALRDRLGLRAGPVLGYIGSLRRLEGIHTMIEALPAVLAERPDAQLLLVGHAPDAYQRELERAVAERGLGSAVLFTGRVSFDQIADYYSLIDLFLVTRPDEPVTRMVTPLKPIEAMACGLPVIASRLDALVELIGHEERGRLYPAGDLAALARVILDLLAAPEQARQLGQNGRAWVEATRSWDRVARHYADVYRQLSARTRAA